MGAVIVFLPVLPAAVYAFIAMAGWRTVTWWFAPVACAAVFAMGIVLAVRVLDHGPVSALGGQLRVDAPFAFARC